MNKEADGAGEKMMAFDEWWTRQPKDPTKPITPRMVWEAATKAEREACAIQKANNEADNFWLGWQARADYKRHKRVGSCADIDDA